MWNVIVLFRIKKHNKDYVFTDFENRGKKLMYPYSKSYYRCQTKKEAIIKMNYLVLHYSTIKKIENKKIAEYLIGIYQGNSNETYTFEFVYPEQSI